MIIENMDSVIQHCAAAARANSREVSRALTTLVAAQDSASRANAATDPARAGGVMSSLRVAAIFLLGAVLGEVWSLYVHADPQPALDRELVERMTRALEAQARAAERCKD